MAFETRILLKSICLVAKNLELCQAIKSTIKSGNNKMFCESELYLGPFGTSMVEPFCENS